MAYYPFGKKGPRFFSLELFEVEFNKFVSSHPEVLGIGAQRRAFALNRGMNPRAYTRYAIRNRILARTIPKGPRARRAIRRVGK